MQDKEPPQHTRPLPHADAPHHLAEMGTAIKHEGGITSLKTMRKRTMRLTRAVVTEGGRREVVRRITATTMWSRRKRGDPRRSRLPQVGRTRGSIQNLRFQATRRMTTIRRLGNPETTGIVMAAICPDQRRGCLSHRLEQCCTTVQWSGQV